MTPRRAAGLAALIAVLAGSIAVPILLAARPDTADLVRAADARADRACLLQRARVARPLRACSSTNSTRRRRTTRPSPGTRSGRRPPGRLRNAASARFRPSRPSGGAGRQRRGAIRPSARAPSHRGTGPPHGRRSRARDHAGDLVPGRRLAGRRRHRRDLSQRTRRPVARADDPRGPRHARRRGGQPRHDQAFRPPAAAD